MNSPCPGCCGFRDRVPAPLSGVQCRENFLGSATISFRYFGMLVEDAGSWDTVDIPSEALGMKPGSLHFTHFLVTPMSIKVRRSQKGEWMWCHSSMWKTGMRSAVKRDKLYSVWEPKGGALTSDWAASCRKWYDAPFLLFQACPPLRVKLWFGLCLLPKHLFGSVLALWVFPFFRTSLMSPSMCAVTNLFWTCRMPVPPAVTILEWWQNSRRGTDSCRICTLLLYLKPWATIKSLVLVTYLYLISF